MRFAVGKTFFVAFGVEVAAGVGRMDFVHQVNLAVVLAEFVFGVYQNQSAFRCNLGTAFEEGHGVLLQYGIFFGCGKTLCQDFFFGDVGIVFANLGFSGRGDDGFREFLVFLHPFGQLHAADFTYTALVGTPCAATEVTAYNHFYGESFTHHTYRHHRIGCSHFPVGADVGCGIQEFCCNLVQHLSFEGNTFRQYYVKG